MLYGTILNAVLILPVCYLVESPRWLYGMGNFEKCAEALTKIAAWNGYKDYEPPNFDARYSIVQQDAGMLVDIDIYENRAS